GDCPRAQGIGTSASETLDDASLSPIFKKSYGYPVRSARSRKTFGRGAKLRIGALELHRISEGGRFTLGGGTFDVRYAPESGQIADISEGPSCANGLNRSRGSSLWQRHGLPDSVMGRPVLR